MKKELIGNQRFLDAFTLQKETLTVTANVATLTKAVDGVALVEATAGSVTGSCGVILNGTVATKEVKLDRTAKTLTFYATDAVTQCYVEYYESVNE